MYIFFIRDDGFTARVYKKGKPVMMLSFPRWDLCITTGCFGFVLLCFFMLTVNKTTSGRNTLRALLLVSAFTHHGCLRYWRIFQRLASCARIFSCCNCQDNKTMKALRFSVLVIAHIPVVRSKQAIKHSNAYQYQMFLLHTLEPSPRFPPFLRSDR